MPNTEDLLLEIQNSLSKFDSDVLIIQSDYWDELLDNLFNLNYKNGLLVQDAANLKKIANVKVNLERFLIRNTEHIKEFAANYKNLEALNNEYYKSIVADFKPDAALKIFKNASLSVLVDNLTGAGINGRVTQKVFNIMVQNMSSGTSRSQMIKQLKTFIKGNESELGALDRYAKQIATDSINQFNASYSSAIIEGLGFTWYRYVGRIKDTTRPFCKALVTQRYIHKSELSNASKGILRHQTVSRAGMVKDTNKDTILEYRGGYNCGHQFRGVTTRSVPKEVRASI